MVDKWPKRRYCLLFILKNLIAGRSVQFCIVSKWCCFTSTHFRDLTSCPRFSDPSAPGSCCWGVGGKPCRDRGMVEWYGEGHDDIGGGDGGVWRKNASRTVRQELWQRERRSQALVTSLNCDSLILLARCSLQILLQCSFKRFVIRNQVNLYFGMCLAAQLVWRFWKVTSWEKTM